MDAFRSFPPPWTTLWDFQNLGDTEQKLRDHLSETEQDRPVCYQIEVQTQIARSLGLQMKYADAHQLLDHVESELEVCGQRTCIYYLLERGRVHQSSGEKNIAVGLFEQAWNLSVAACEEPLAMDAAHMVAIAAEPDVALRWSADAIALAEQSDNPLVTKWLGPLYNNTGWTYEEQGEFDQAMELFQKGLQFRLQQGWTPETVIALWTIAHTQRKQGKLDDAWNTLTQVAQRWHDLGEQPDGYTWEEQAECLLAQNKMSEAQPYFQKAWEILSGDEWLCANENSRLERLRQLAGQNGV